MCRSHLQEGDPQVVHQLATNLIRPIHLVRAVLPHLRAQGGGRIIGLSTYGGQAAFPGGSLYHASKWGLEGFLDSGMVHVMLKDTARMPPGDPAKMSTLIIESAGQEPVPRRIVLGTDSWGIIRKALAERLSAVDAQKDSAASTDIPANM